MIQVVKHKDHEKHKHKLEHKALKHEDQVVLSVCSILEWWFLVFMMLIIIRSLLDDD